MKEENVNTGELPDAEKQKPPDGKVLPGAQSNEWKKIRVKVFHREILKHQQQNILHYKFNVR